MDGLNAQIALTQAKLTSAVKRGEPEDSPQIRHDRLGRDARLERMRRLWVTHRQIRLGLETHEGRHVSRVN
jgi:hypothetical protein